MNQINSSRESRSTILFATAKTILAQRNLDGMHFFYPQDAQKVQPSHPPNPDCYFTRPP